MIFETSKVSPVAYARLAGVLYNTRDVNDEVTPYHPGREHLHHTICQSKMATARKGE